MVRHNRHLHEEVLSLRPIIPTKPFDISPLTGSIFLQTTYSKRQLIIYYTILPFFCLVLYNSSCRRTRTRSACSVSGPSGITCAHLERRQSRACVCVCVLCVCFPIHSGHQVRWTYQPGVTQEEGHTGFLIHLLSAVRALIFLARRIQPFLSLVDREIDFCVLTI